MGNDNSKHICDACDMKIYKNGYILECGHKFHKKCSNIVTRGDGRHCVYCFECGQDRDIESYIHTK